jgi:hypothetical protein
MALLRSLRSLVLGETWTIPLGVAATIAIASLLHSALPGHVWSRDGGVVIAVLVVAILALSLARDR